AFRLSEFECDVLLFALALESDLKYETLYGYLNNDITRKFPTVDLALRVCGYPMSPGSQAALLSAGKLFDSGLLEYNDLNATSRSYLAQGFVINASVANFLLGLPVRDRALDGLARFHPAGCETGDTPGNRAAADRLAAVYRNGQAPDIVLLQGLKGSGRKSLAHSVCAGLGLRMFSAGEGLLLLDPDEIGEKIKSLCLHACILKAGLCFELDNPGLVDGKIRRALITGIAKIRRFSLPVFVCMTPDQDWRYWQADFAVLRLVLSDPDARERLALWRYFFQKHRLSANQGDIEDLANGFQLNAGQMENAAKQLALEFRGRPLGREDLFSAARDQSVAEIGKLASRVSLTYGWDDLVLPEATLKRIRDIVQAVKHRAKVYDDWEMANRVANANSLTVLFSGASGTGKTMTAGVIAREIGLSLYRIDLAGVVSKYIGETEKNLDRIFNAARRANAILFLDEADALMGKRSEVKDAHDRYANIEVAYLLQKMEEFDGVVILATNLYKNLDQAFSRRMHYIVEFPRPDAVHRERLWRTIFPARMPLGEDVDFRFLATHFGNTGGDIKNIALDAAFLAAQNGQVVTMQELIRAMARQMIKQGKAPSAAEFKQYHGLIE
ncbi:MAG: ATP-binding protein, partial [Gammaproteobacteria bacterium]